MIETDLSHQLHSLAATVDEPVDLVALHRRISVQGRRRAAVKVGLAGAGVAAVVGGVFVVRDEHSGSAGGGLAAASSIASTATAAPDCTVVLAAMQSAKSTEAAVVPKRISTDTSSTTGDLPEANFKGLVTILATDGSQITFSSDEPEATPTSGVAIVDASTLWMDGSTHLDTAPTIQVGQHVGLATAVGSDGVDRVIFIDIGFVSAEAKVADAKPDDNNVQPADSTTVDPSGAPASLDLPGAALPPGPTEKARGTVVATDAASISVTVADASGQERTLAIDLASTPFYAGDTQCVPGALAIGTELGVAFHFDDAGAVVSDAVMVMPSA